MFTDAITRANDRASLLAEVEFKWLMAGHGWWIDMARFQRDALYAAELLDLAMASQSSALRDCSAVLRSRAGPTARRAA